MDETESASLICENQLVQKPKHRIDIQWLRAIAILAVLVFHLDSNLLKNGYLGVDMFFVISGYLMSCILNYSTKKELSLELLKTFYIRRIKRIIPVYLLTVLLTLVICSFYLLESDYNDLTTDTVWAMEYMTNILSILTHEDYFKKINEFKFLLHTWSLSVEIQYYLISPFLLYLIYKGGKSLYLTFLMMIVSYGFQVYTSFHEPTSFGFLFSRIWQFMIGTFVYYLGKKDDYDGEFSKWKKIIYFGFLVVLLIVLITPYDKRIIRPVITVLTGILIYLGNSVEPEGIISKSLECIGDISYSVYLIHWPIIVLLKYQLIPVNQNLILYTFLIFLISSIQYKFVEKPLAQVSNKSVLVLIGITYLFIFVTLSSPQGFGLKDDSNLTLHIRTNIKLLKECDDQLARYNHCSMDLPLEIPKEWLYNYVCTYFGNGTGTLLIVGNSFAVRQSTTLINQLNGKYGKVYLVSQPSCTIFTEFNKPNWDCHVILNRFVEITRMIKPDVIISTQRLSSLEGSFTSSLKSPEDAINDVTTQILRNYWKEYSKLTKQIIIVEPHPIFDNTTKTSMIKLLRENQNLDDYYISEEDWDSEINPGWWRVQASIDQCQICSPVLIKKYFCHKDRKCDIYDRDTKTMLFCDSSHLNSLGSKRIVDDIIKKISNKLIY